MPVSLKECELVGHAGEVSTGLDLALDGLTAEAAPGEVVALPAHRVPAGLPVVRHDIGAGEGVTFARPPARRPAPPGELTALGTRLGAVRLGLTRRLLAAAVDHLSGRVVQGEPTVRRQLVQAALADARVTVRTARHCLRAAGDVPAAVVDVHDRVTALDWELTKLLGASGYVGRGPARTAFVSRLVANCWLSREGVA